MRHFRDAGYWDFGQSIKIITFMNATTRISDLLTCIFTELSEHSIRTDGDRKMDSPSYIMYRSVVIKALWRSWFLPESVPHKTLRAYIFFRIRLQVTPRQLCLLRNTWKFGPRVLSLSRFLGERHTFRNNETLEDKCTYMLD